MVDYWRKLPFSKRNKQDRFNFILDHIDKVTSSSDESEKPKPKPEEPTVTTSDISVTVLDDEDNPISGATVTVYDANNLEYSSTTGKLGGCTIRNVPLGDCVIETVKEDYVTSEDDFTVVAGENTFTVKLVLNEGPEGIIDDMLIDEEGD